MKVGFKNYFTEGSATENTEFYETCSVLGSIMSTSDFKIMQGVLQGKIKHTQAIAVAKSVLSKKEDWSTTGSKIIKNLKVRDVDEIVDLCSLASGMYKFVKEVLPKEVGINKVHFIHNNINKYYNVEKETMGEIPGTKKNTADCVLSNVDADKLLSSFAKNKPEIAKNGKYVKIGKTIKFIPVSLKKAVGGAQLGKISTFIRTNLQLGIDNDEAIEKITDNNIISFEKYLKEGLFDWAKGLIISAYEKLTDFVKNVVSKLSNKFISIFKMSKPPESYMSELYDEFGGVMTESKTGSRDEQLAKAVKKNPDKAIKSINREIKKLNTVVKDYMPDLIYQKTELIKSIKLKRGQEMQESFFLLGNYLASRRAKKIKIHYY